MSIRKNNAYDQDRFDKVLNEEAERNGFKVKFIEEKMQVKKK
jgi:hypothetical protein